MILRIAHLYPDALNLYGDSGNVLCLEKRMQWRNIECKTDKINIGDICNFSDYDIVFIGGGQDFEQSLVLDDISRGNDTYLKNAVKEGVSVLAICGGFQLLGKFYKTHTGEIMNFTGILDFYTVGKEKRIIGNYAFRTAERLEIIGFENHSGRTFLGKNVKPLGRIIKGSGNNGKDKTEGVRFNNTFGTYCHGPILPKNPDFADMIIEKAIERKYGKFELLTLENSAELLARSQVKGLYI